MPAHWMATRYSPPCWYSACLASSPSSGRTAARPWACRCGAFASRTLTARPSVYGRHCCAFWSLSPPGYAWAWVFSGCSGTGTSAAGMTSIPPAAPCICRRISIRTSRRKTKKAGSAPAFYRLQQLTREAQQPDTRQGANRRGNQHGEQRRESEHQTGRPEQVLGDAEHEAHHHAGKDPLTQGHRAQWTEDEGDCQQHQRGSHCRLQDLAPERQPILTVIQTLLGQVMDIAPQAGYRQRFRLQHHSTEQLWVQLDVPAFIRCFYHLGAALTEMRGRHILQLPVIALILCAPGKAGRQHVALVIEAITGHPQQDDIRLQRIDMHELFALAVPQAAPGALRLATALRHGTIGLSLVFAPGRQVLADQNAGQHQHQHWLHHRPDDAPDRNPGGAHDGQLAVAGQAAQADQTPDQGRHRQHLVDPPRQGQKDVPGRPLQTITTLDIAHLVDEGKQQCQADDDPQHREDREKYLGADVAIQSKHEPPPPRRGDSPISDATVPNRAAQVQSTEILHAPTTSLAPGGFVLCPGRCAQRSAAPGTSYTRERPAAA